MDTGVKGKRTKVQKISAPWIGFEMSGGYLTKLLLISLGPLAVFLCLYYSWGNPEHLKWHEENDSEKVIEYVVRGKNIEYKGKHKDSPEHYLLIVAKNKPSFKKSICVSRTDYMSHKEGSSWWMKTSVPELEGRDCPMESGWRNMVFGILSFFGYPIAVFLYACWLSDYQLPSQQRLANWYWGLDERKRQRFRYPTTFDWEMVQKLEKSLKVIPSLAYVGIGIWVIYLLVKLS